MERDDFIPSNSAIASFMTINPAWPVQLAPDALCYWIALDHIHSETGEIKPEKMKWCQIPMNARFCTGDCILFSIAPEKFIDGKIGMLDKHIPYAACARNIWVAQSKKPALIMSQVLQRVRSDAREQVQSCLALHCVKRRLHRTDIFSYRPFLHAGLGI